MFSFLKYHEDAKPGKSLKRKGGDDDNKKAKRSEYESKRRPDRLFNSKWQEGRDWLVFDKDKNVMTCSVCTEFYKGEHNIKPTNKGVDKFIEGSGNMRKSAVTDHECSKLHVQAISVTCSRKSSVVEVAQSRAGKTLQAIKESDRRRLTYLFRNAHAVAKHNRPLTDYVWMCKLDKAKSIDIGETYINEKACFDFITCIAENERDKLIKFLDKAHFFSFLMDGSTDISGNEQETIYLRASYKGIVSEKFLSIGSPASTSSNDLYSYTKETFNSTGIMDLVNIGKFVGMGSDGASNMMGKNNGLGKQLQNEHTEIILVHCLNHRLELGFRDAFKSQKYYDRLMSLLIGLHYFYIKSSKQKKGLLETMKALQVNGILPPKVTGTRWLPHLHRSLKSLLRNYTVYNAHLSTVSHQNAKAEGMAKMLLDKNLMSFVLMLQDLLDPLQRLSLQLQKAGITLSDVFAWSDTTCQLLGDCKTRNNAALQTLLDSGTYEGVTLKGKTPTMVYKNDLIDKLIKSITDRFSLDQSASGIIESTRICNFSLWPTESDELKDFGNEAVKTILTHFSSTLHKAGVDQDEVPGEWLMLKKLLLKRHGDDTHTLTWSQANKECSELRNILILVDLLCSLPPTSVSCETTFSQMKLIKTARRSRMSNTTLNNLMMVKLESEILENFCPDAAIDSWLVAPVRCRRLNYARSVKPQLTDEVVTINVNPEPETSAGASGSQSQGEMPEEENDQLEVEVEIFAYNRTMEKQKEYDEDSDYFSDYEQDDENTKRIIQYANNMN